MKHIRTYEQSSNEPQIGEYAICDIAFTSGQEFREQMNNFVKNNIGKILEIDNIHGKNFEKYYHIYYQNVPKEFSRFFGWRQKYDFSEYFLNIHEDSIICHSIDKEKLELLIHTNKYNL